MYWSFIHAGSRIGLEKAEYSIAEDGGILKVCVKQLRQGRGVIATGKLTIRDITTNAQGFSNSSYIDCILICTLISPDYNMEKDTINFPRFTFSYMKECVDIEIVNDTFAEKDEKFEITLSSDHAKVIVEPEAKTAVVTITDNDEPDPNIIGLQETEYSVSEKEGTLEVCVELIKRTTGPVRGTLAFHDITTIAGEGIRNVCM